MFLLADYFSFDDASIFHLCNSIFIFLLFATIFFLFILYQQREITSICYEKELVGKHFSNVLYSCNWDQEELPVFIVIPGNPGHGGFYQEYINLLVEESKGIYRGCVVSHIGHSPATSRVFSVKDQVDSKIKFITSKLKPGTSITLIGHSFGAYIALKILEKGIKIDLSIMLFPMIENMARMPKADNLRTMLKYQPLIIGVAWLTGLLPRQLRIKMIQFYAGKFSRNMQDHIAGSISELIEAKSLANVFGLAQNELSVVQELDYNLIKRFQKKLVFYYGMFDLWAPLDCCRKLRKAVPGVNVHIADDDVSHTFMFTSCKKVAQKTLEFMKGDSKYDMSNLIPDSVVKSLQGETDDYDFCEEE